MRAICPEVADLKVLSTAQELGYVLNYNKVQSRATQRKRHTIALTHLVRLRKLKLQVQTRAKIAHYALQRALWGTHTYVVGLHWLNDLRTAIGKTLVPGHAVSNSHLACLFASQHLDDPTLYLIWDNLRQVRQFLQSQPVTTRRIFFYRVSRHSCHHKSVWGPAGAFAYNLHRVGWHCTKEGIIQTHTPEEFHLLNADVKALKEALDRAWIVKVFTQCLTRPGWTNLPFPSRRETLQILREFEDSEQQILLKSC
eukprot:Skav219172  [mRNA]  locus=scaffold648:370123:370884:- [translate_table: standard]